MRDGRDSVQFDRDFLRVKYLVPRHVQLGQSLDRILPLVAAGDADNVEPVALECVVGFAYGRDLCLAGTAP